MFIKKRELRNIKDRLYILEHQNKIGLTEKMMVGDMEIPVYREFNLADLVHNLIKFLNVEMTSKQISGGLRKREVKK